jgi:transmembrane sensor
MSLLKWICAIWDKVSRRYGESRLFEAAAKSAIATFGSILVHLVFTALSSAPDRDRTHTGSLVTKRGEYRCENLPEQSHICLNTDSEVRYRFNEATRNVEVLRGEASFVVVRNDRRPFEVRAGDLLVHDISTGFEIYRKRDSTQVSVTEGRTRVVGPIATDTRLKFEHGEAEDAWKAAPELRKFERGEFDETTRTFHRLPDLSERGILRLLAWEQGRIDLKGRTVSETIQELARYQEVPEFRYASASIASTRLDGDLACDDLEGLLTTLQSEYHISHTKTGVGSDTVIMLRRQGEKTGGNHSR